MPTDAAGPGAEARRARHSAPARDKHTGALEGRPPGIQFFVFPKEVIVHLIVCGFEIVNIRLVGGWSWKLHVGSCSKGPDAESPFAARHKGQEGSQSDYRQNSEHTGHEMAKGQLGEQLILENVFQSLNYFIHKCKKPGSMSQRSCCNRSQGRRGTLGLGYRSAASPQLRGAPKGPRTRGTGELAQNTVPAPACVACRLTGSPVPDPEDNSKDVTARPTPGRPVWQVPRERGSPRNQSQVPRSL